jgi:hypothetical protein
MDISVIPDYLGGENTRRYSEDLKNERLFLEESQGTKHQSG